MASTLSSTHPSSPSLEGKKKKSERKASEPPLPLTQFGPSSIDPVEFKKVFTQLGDTRGYSVEIPGVNERPLFPRSTEKTFWLFQLQAGLHFPIPPFFVKPSKMYRIPLNQVNPASIRNVIFFHMILTLEGVKDTAKLFFKTHELKHRGFHMYFSSVKWFANFYGRYESLDRKWHAQYLVVLPPPGSS